MAYKSLFYLALLAPATTFAATINKRDLSPSHHLPSGFRYVGCFFDSPEDRVFTSAVIESDDNLTGASCSSFCASKGYPYSGTEFSDQCYCGLSQPSESSNNCNMPCAGDSSEVCGGPNGITVYYNPRAAPHTYPGDYCWEPLGCYTDSVSARSLERRVSTPGGDAEISAELCLETCRDQGFTFAGLEYGKECWCGSNLASSAQETDGCDMTCQGRHSEFCGGRDALDVYSLYDYCRPRSTTWGDATWSTKSTKTSVSSLTTTSSSASSTTSSLTTVGVLCHRCTSSLGMGTPSASNFPRPVADIALSRPRPRHHQPLLLLRPLPV